MISLVLIIFRSYDTSYDCYKVAANVGDNIAILLSSVASIIGSVFSLSSAPSWWFYHRHFAVTAMIMFMYRGCLRNYTTYPDRVDVGLLFSVPLPQHISSWQVHDMVPSHEGVCRKEWYARCRKYWYWLSSGTWRELCIDGLLRRIIYYQYGSFLRNEFDLVV